MSKERINITLAAGGLGDKLCSLVAVDYNIRNYPHCEFLVWVPDHMLEFSKHVLSPGATIRPFSKAKNKYDKTLPGLTTQHTGFHTEMRTHPIDYSFHVLTDKHIYDLNEKNYLKIKPELINIDRFKLPERYVVMTAAAAVKCKEMPVKTANELIDYVLNKGYTPVFLGKQVSDIGVKDLKILANPIDIDYNKGVNLLDKTSLLESAKIIHESAAIIGTDGGLIHLAGFTDTNIIAAYTLASPSHLAPIRNGSQTYKFFPVEPDENVPNRYFQTNANFNFGVDYREFPGWEVVRDNITADKFVKYLDKIL